MMNQQLNKVFSGHSVLPRVPGRGSLQVTAASRTPNWKLEQPKRLWEIVSDPTSLACNRA